MAPVVHGTLQSIVRLTSELMDQQLPTAIEFWKHAEALVSETQARTDELLRFTIGALSAVTVWLAASQRVGTEFALIPIALGTLAAGYVTHLHFQAKRLRSRARALAVVVRRLANIGDEDWPYADRFLAKRLLSVGHPVTGPLFDVVVILLLSFAYAFGLAVLF